MNQNQLSAQYPSLFVVRSPTRFGQSYWSPSGSHRQRCLALLQPSLCLQLLKLLRSSGLSDNGKSIWPEHVGNLPTNRKECFFILVIDQLDVQNLCFQISLFHASTCFEHNVLIIRRSKLYYTDFDIITLKQVSGLNLLKYNSINMSK